MRYAHVCMCGSAAANAVHTWHNMLPHQSIAHHLASRPASLPCSDQALALSLFRGFFYNRTVVDLAQEVMQQAGWRFHAAHLRIEDDADVWNKRDGGSTGALQEYIKVMRNASFVANTTVYVASGLLYNGSSPGGWAGGRAVGRAFRSSSVGWPAWP